MGGIITFTKPNNSFKALVFDFDGLIVDTEEPEFIAWQSVYKSYGAKLELDEWLACVGASLKVFDPLINLQARVQFPIDTQRVQFEKDEYFSRLTQDITALPGVKDYLYEAKNLGLKLAVASSSSYSWVNGLLNKLNLRSMFDALCVSEDVSAVKPDPALYALAVTRLDVAPYEAVAFEDSYNGLLSAKRAGLYCIVVPNRITQSLDFSIADRVLHSLSEISLPELLANLNGCCQQ